MWLGYRAPSASFENPRLIFVKNKRSICGSYKCWKYLPPLKQSKRSKLGRCKKGNVGMSQMFAEKALLLLGGLYTARRLSSLWIGPCESRWQSLHRSILPLMASGSDFPECSLAKNGMFLSYEIQVESCWLDGNQCDICLGHRWLTWLVLYISSKYC